MKLTGLAGTRASFGALSPHRQGLLAVLAAAVLWSSGGLFIKWVSLDALGVTMWRSLLAAITMWLIARPAIRLPWRTGRLTWAIAVSYALTLVLFVSATKLTTAANAIFLQYTAPIYLLVAGAVFLKERPTWLDLATVAVAFGGMALFFVGKIEADALDGNILAVLSGIALAAMFILLRAPSCTPRTRPEAMLLGNILLVLGLLAANLVRGSSAPFTPDISDLFGLAFLGVIQIGLAYLLFGFGVAHVQALEASLIGMLEPVLNPVWVLIFLGETPGWWAVLGGAIIVAAVAVRTAISERRRSDASSAVAPAGV